MFCVPDSDLTNYTGNRLHSVQIFWTLSIRPRFLCPALNCDCRPTGWRSLQ